MSKIIVAGSSNIDMNIYVKKLPRPGETIGEGRFMQANGGKGANQAVARVPTRRSPQAGLEVMSCS